MKKSSIAFGIIFGIVCAIVIAFACSSVLDGIDSAIGESAQYESDLREAVTDCLEDQMPESTIENIYIGSAHTVAGREGTYYDVSFIQDGRFVMGDLSVSAVKSYMK